MVQMILLQLGVNEIPFFSFLFFKANKLFLLRILFAFGSFCISGGEDVGDFVYKV